MDRTLIRAEITVLSCEDLRLDKKLVKKNTYVIVRTDPLNVYRTMTDEQGGSYPSWNEKFDIQLVARERYVTLEVYCKKPISSDRLVGSARMPLNDFMGGYLPENYLSFLSYRLRNGNGERNGVINVSVRAIKTTKTTSFYESRGHDQFCSMEKPVLAFPFMWRNHENNFETNGLVTGIPVSCVNRG